MLRAQILLVAGGIALACLLTPWIYGALLALDPGASWPFSRVFNRVAMLGALILLVALRKRVGFERVGRAFGTGDWGGRTRALGFGLVLAIVASAAVFPLLYADPGLRWSGIPVGRLLLKLLEAAIGGVLASLLEEGFFRVMVFGALRRKSPVVLAAVLTSAFYAALHFLSSVETFRHTAGAPFEGFAYFGEVLGVFVRPEIYPGLLGLFLVGCVLCLAMVRSGSVWLCVGIHAGWFVAAKAAVHTVAAVERGGLPSGVAKRYLLLGSPWTWLSILVVGVVIHLAARRFKDSSNREQAAPGSIRKSRA